MLDLEPGHLGPEVSCGGGYREKTVDTVLGAVRQPRAYYHCRECGHSLFLRDRGKRIQDGSLSAWLHRTVARAGNQEPFANASRDLLELASLHLTSKRVEHSSEADGDKVRAAIQDYETAVAATRSAPNIRRPQNSGQTTSVGIKFGFTDGTGPIGPD